tara:strand:- start:369 stop:509 length:141 start_codon:yes stop_codon:yes gene_type:complete
MKRLLIPLLAVLAILIALAIPAFIPLEVTNVECTNDTKYCLDGIRE